MDAPYAQFITPAIHILTLAITGISAYRIYSQQSTSYNYVRNTLVLVYIFFSLVIVLEFLRVTYVTLFGRSPGPFFIRLYAEGGTSLIILDVWLLTLAAVTIHFRPSGYLRGIFSDIMKNPRHRLAFISFSSYMIFAEIFLLTFHPYSIITLENLWGVTIVSSPLSQNYLLILLIVLVAFIAYPTYLIIAASRKFAEPAIKRALVTLPICWSAIGLDLLIFNGYLWIVGIDANDVGYLVAATVFSITALVFRRASVLASFFEVKPLTLEGPLEYPFSRRLGVGKEFLGSRNILLEVNPATDYEKVIIDFAKEVISTKHILFTFTSRGSPIHRALSESHDKIGVVRFFILTDKVSYPKPTEGQLNEIMVPQHDHSVLLDVLDKTLRSIPDSSIAVLFDSITDLILSLGLEKTYNFLKQSNEILSNPRAMSLFIINEPAHDDKMMTLIRGLFPNHLTYTDEGLKATKQA
ncbi:MAG: hypothetical protein HYY67_03750 [Thaumarchaeota archaeon]|nr:hypothetical protein [Nitrososphaerota archaeon]